MASRDSSNLSRSPPYGWHVVVGVTQASLNATLKRFLRNLQAPLVEILYVFNKNTSSYEEITLAELKAKAKGVDPFTVPNGTDIWENRDVKYLRDANFRCAMRVQMGIPEEYNPPGGLSLIRLDGGTHQVEWNLLCSTFHLVAIDFERESYINVKQDPAEPWIFSSMVDMRMYKMEESSYDKLSEDVRRQIEKFEKDRIDFSVETILFDLNRAYLKTIPVVRPIERMPQFSSLLNHFFSKLYLEALQRKGAPLLGVTLVPDQTPTPASLTISGIRYWVNSFVGPQGKEISKPDRLQSEAITFNYLCSTDGAEVSSPYQMNWNWVLPSQQIDHHGALAINRSTFAKWFTARLKTDLLYASSLMVVPTIHDDGGYSVRLFDNQKGTLHNPQSGDSVLEYHWHWEYEEDKSSTRKFKCENEYSCNVEFTGITIKITQHQRWYVSAKWGAGPENSDFSNVVDIWSYDTWTIDADADGKLVFDHKNTVIDKSFPFRFKVRRLQKTIDRAKSFVTGAINSITPPNEMRTFFFPGGRTFSFKRPRFSSNQDLVSEITYKDPTAVMQFIPIDDYRPVPRKTKFTDEDLEAYQGTGYMGTRFRTHEAGPSTLE